MTVRQIAACGLESWTQMNKVERYLMAWERKILRKYMDQHVEMVAGE